MEYLHSDMVFKKFNSTKESFLEKVESCDSNRICDNYGGQFMLNIHSRPLFQLIV